MVGNKQLTKLDVSRAADELSKFICNNKIESAEGFNLLVGQYFFNLDRFILIEPRPSNLETTSTSFAYVRQGIGAVIDVRMNSKLNYAKIILKSTDIFPRYSKFATDPFGNFVQGTENFLLDVGEIKKSLEILVRT